MKNLEPQIKCLKHKYIWMITLTKAKNWLKANIWKHTIKDIKKVNIVFFQGVFHAIWPLNLQSTRLSQQLNHYPCQKPWKLQKIICKRRIKNVHTRLKKTMCLYFLNSKRRLQCCFKKKSLIKKIKLLFQTISVLKTIY